MATRGQSTEIYPASTGIESSRARIIDGIWNRVYSSLNILLNIRLNTLALRVSRGRSTEKYPTSTRIGGRRSNQQPQRLYVHHHGTGAPTAAFASLLREVADDGSRASKKRTKLWMTIMPTRMRGANEKRKSRASDAHQRRTSSILFIPALNSSIQKGSCCCFCTNCSPNLQYPEQ